MSQIDLGWGGLSGPRYESLASKFRPVFARIAETAIQRELDRGLPHDQIVWLKEAGFGAVRLTTEEGGHGATLPEFMTLLIELSEADSNITQALRGHFGFAENIVNTASGSWRVRWADRLSSGQIAGNAWTEIGDAKIGGFSTRVSEKDGKLVLNGAKYYTTGSLYADWIDVGASNSEGEGVGVLVRRHAEGVSIVDDWDGFGQTLTASGTTTFTDVPVEADDVIIDGEKFRYSAAFYQIVHLATLAGIGRALSNEVSKAVAERRRTYSNAAGPRSSQDPQVLQVVGKVRSAAYSAGAIVLQVAQALERAFQAHFAGDEQAEETANAIAELETSQALNVVSDLILGAATIAFDALGASAIKKPLGLDRHWRNARTLSSHNPRIYKDRIVGDFAVNGTLPPYQWRIGLGGA
jgi:alkylation response protein AidB-like acyl-CoA dehydrogenase